MVKTNFKEFNIKESPFHEEYDGKKEPFNVRIEPNAKKLLTKHFDEIYEKDGLSIGIRNIIYDYLDKLCLKKKIFNHLEAVMLIPKSDDIDVMESQSQIISVINIKSDFNKNFNHYRRFGAEMDAVYGLSFFNEDNFHYVMEMFKNTIDSCVYNTSKEDLKSFDSFKQRQAELYPDLDLDDCYFIRFPLNNLMDNVNQGKSVHYKSWKNNHLGGYILTDVIQNSSKFLLIDWYYLSEISSQIRVDFQFVPEDYFMDNFIMDSYLFDVTVNDDFYIGDERIFYAFNSYFDGDYTKTQLKKLKEELLSRLSRVDESLNMLEDIKD